MKRDCRNRIYTAECDPKTGSAIYRGRKIDCQKITDTNCFYLVTTGRMKPHCEGPVTVFPTKPSKEGFMGYLAENHMGALEALARIMAKQPLLILQDRDAKEPYAEMLMCAIEAVHYRQSDEFLNAESWVPKSRSLIAKDPFGYTKCRMAFEKMLKAAGA